MVFEVLSKLYTAIVPQSYAPKDMKRGGNYYFIQGGQ